MTASECLQHPMFDDLHEERKLPEPVKGPQIEMPTFAEGEYDYENGIPTGLQYDDLKRLLFEEVLRFKPLPNV